MAVVDQPAKRHDQDNIEELTTTWDPDTPETKVMVSELTTAITLQECPNCPLIFVAWTQSSRIPNLGICSAILVALPHFRAA